jgi:hypothetical protein
METVNVSDAIRNLEMMSDALGRMANRPENYNTGYAQYLEMMGWEMYKYANELKDLRNSYGEAI